jgi:hypothetical protein
MFNPPRNLSALWHSTQYRERNGLTSRAKLGGGSATEIDGVAASTNNPRSRAKTIRMIHLYQKHNPKFIFRARDLSFRARWMRAIARSTDRETINQIGRDPTD